MKFCLAIATALLIVNSSCGGAYIDPSYKVGIDNLKSKETIIVSDQKKNLQSVKPTVGSNYVQGWDNKVTGQDNYAIGK
jgi:hypothetical protein